jgi:hypothetical protein
VKPQTAIYYPDGRILKMIWKPGTFPAYAWLRRAVGGLLESVDRFVAEAEKTQAYADEEGRLKNLPVNVPGMKAVSWPEPPQGWDLYERDLESVGGMAPPPSGPVIVHSEMSEEELRRAWRHMQHWSPLCGPVLVLRGWSDDYEDECEQLNPESLGDDLS